MKKVIFIATFLLLFVSFFGCIPTQSTRSVEIKSAAGNAPDFYPGNEMTINDWEQKDYREYLRVHKSAINDIGRTILAIRTGKIQPGCLGVNVYTCIATLSQTLAVTSDYRLWEDRPDDPLTEDKIDINGKVLFSKDVSFYAYVPGWKYADFPTFDALKYQLFVGDDRKVKRIIVHFPSDPFHARTKEEYEKTGLYEGISPLLKPTCSDLNREEIYRFFENKMKPVINTSYSETYIGPDRFSKGEVTFCERKLSFSSLVGHSISQINRHNSTGVYGGGLIIIE